MLFIFVTLIIVAIVLFVSSYFITDKVDQLEEQLEQFTITTQQDTYQLNRKMRLVEKQLNDYISSGNKNNITDNENRHSINPIVIQKIKHLHEQGYSTDDIVNQTNISEEDVHHVLTKHFK